MKVIDIARVPPRSEVVDAVVRGARLGDGPYQTARRHGISVKAAWGMLAEAIDTTADRNYRRGYRDGRIHGMPNLPRVAA